MKAERTIRAALRTLFKKYGYDRDEVFLASKIGYIPEDSDNGIPGRVLV